MTFQNIYIYIYIYKYICIYIIPFINIINKGAFTAPPPEGCYQNLAVQVKAQEINKKEGIIDKREN